MEKHRKMGRFPVEARERAVRFVRESEASHASRWAALVSASGKIGCTAETLRRWVREAEIDSGVRPDVTTDTAARVEELEREVRELRQANEILKKASAYFAQPRPGGPRLHHRRCRGQETSAGRSSTARGGSDRLYGRSSRRAWGRADVHTVGNACVDGTNKHVLSGPIRVSDGDTVVIAGERVRFLGMDSPEQDQPCVADDSDWACGIAATAALEALIDGHGVECRAPDRDRYHRWLAVCWRDDGMELNAEMVLLGWALAHRPGNDPSRVAA